MGRTVFELFINRSRATFAGVGEVYLRAFRSGVQNNIIHCVPEFRGRSPDVTLPISSSNDSLMNLIIIIYIYSIPIVFLLLELVIEDQRDGRVVTVPYRYKLPVVTYNVHSVIGTVVLHVCVFTSILNNITILRGLRGHNDIL